MAVWTRNSRSCLMGILAGVFITSVVVTLFDTEAARSVVIGGLNSGESAAKICGEPRTSDSLNNNRHPHKRALQLTNNALGLGEELSQVADNVIASDRGAEDVDDDDGDDEVFLFDAKRGLADVTRKYATHPFVLSGDSWDKLIHDYPVCMATQTSVDRMYWVANVSESWHGPLSVSIFVPDVELHLAKTVIKFLRRCSPAVADRVSFHFVSDVAHPPVDFSAEADDVDLDCNSIHESITKFVDAGRSEEMMKWRDSMIYPQQLLRNVARQGCLAEYVTLVDVDMIPRPGLAEDLRSFLRKKETQSCEKCAYVLPVYEIAETAGKLPENKADLVKMITAKRARPFHQIISKKNSGSSNLTAWQAVPSTSNELKVAYDVLKFELQYEPIYVTKGPVPFFDERFEGFGCTRWTQAYEMLVLGFQFKVLDNAFLSHWGFQVLKTRPKWRAKQQEANNRRLDQYSQEFVAKYHRDPLNLQGYSKKAAKFVIAYGH